MLFILGSSNELPTFDFINSPAFYMMITQATTIKHYQQQIKISLEQHFYQKQNILIKQLLGSSYFKIIEFLFLIILNHKQKLYNMKHSIQYTFTTPSRSKVSHHTKNQNTPSTAQKIAPDSQFDHYSRQNSSIVKLIGYDRLLQSFSNPMNRLQNSEINAHTYNIEDRFIPSRKLLKKDYTSMDIENEFQGPDTRDPQMTPIAEIYYQEILGAKDTSQIQLAQERQQFRNNNLLKYRYTHQQIGNLNDFNQCLQNDPAKSLLNICHKNPFQKCRKIPKTPCKVLDAPALQDDFYLNLIDWSHKNQLAVGLGNCIYLWDADTSKVTKLCQLMNDVVTSVCWASKGSLLSIGCNKGDVLVWDIHTSKQIRKMGGHDNRVGAMTWNSKALATGSRDKAILQRDVRAPTDYVIKMEQHTQEICGLKWSLDEQYLSSGGNDNKVAVWTNSGQIVNKFTDHKAAVKALAWSPHQHGLLATGGGTADRMIKMRNILTGKIVCQKDAGSQVCNIAFSKSLHEIVSTHGYSQNQINIWTYPNMRKTATLIGHSQRVLYLASSPDGSTIVTGAGDETLRFWNVFPSTKQAQQTNQNTSMIEIGSMLR